MRKAAFCALAALLASTTAVSPTRAGSGIPDAVESAAAFNTAELSGVIVEERHIDLNASAGPAHYSEQNDAIMLLEDGQYKRVRYLHIVQNGRTLDSDELSQRETQNNNDLDAGKAFFKQPFDARYLHDYEYSETPCACAPHVRQITFRSDIRDDQHGDGTMLIDSSSRRVLSLTYAPNALPAHASSGTTVETFGQTAAGAWTIVSIDHTYSGHVAFIRGNGTMTERLDHVVRFESPVTAMQYLQSTSK